MFSREASKMSFHMLGKISLKKYLGLQQRLVEDLSYASDRIQVI